MVAKQTTRFIGFIICVPMSLLILWQYRRMVSADFAALFNNIPVLVNDLMYFMFIIGVGLSFHSQIVGGIMVFLSPTVLFIIDCVNAGGFVMPSASATVMLAGSAFLLLTAEKNRD